MQTKEPISGDQKPAGKEPQIPAALLMKLLFQFLARQVLHRCPDLLKSCSNWTAFQSQTKKNKLDKKKVNKRGKKCLKW